MNLTEEQVIELFEEFLDENYYVDMLTEEDLDYVFENEFPQWLEERFQSIADLGKGAWNLGKRAVQGISGFLSKGAGAVKQGANVKKQDVVKGKSTVPSVRRLPDWLKDSDGTPFYVMPSARNTKRLNAGPWDKKVNAATPVAKQGAPTSAARGGGGAADAVQRGANKIRDAVKRVAQKAHDAASENPLSNATTSFGAGGVTALALSSPPGSGPNQKSKQKDKPSPPKTPPLPVRKTPPLPVRKPKNEEVQFTEEEQVIELFEEFLDENYYVGELTEANILWVYEEEFLPALEQQIEESAGCDCENCECENCQCENVQEEQQISPKMQAYLNEMSKKGTKSIEHGGDGATTKRDVIIARLKAKEKNSGLSREEAKLLAKLIAAEEKEDSGKKK